jgi:phage regulator Rha-like protein
MSKIEQLIPLERISSKIYVIRNEKVLLDFDLAELYGVPTKQLKRAVRRNIDRFPVDFMIPLTKEEYNSLRSQFGTLKRGEHSKYLPYAFTEQGVAMLSSVLNSERAIKVNIAIMRAFVKMRKILESNESLAKKLKQLEKETKEKFAEHQQQISLIFEAIKELMTEKEKPKRRIGF